MADSMNRRSFLELSGKASLAGMAGATGIDKILDKFSNAQDKPLLNQRGNNTQSAASVISLPKGGGAVKGIGEKFQANPFTGTANFSVPIYTSPGRGGFGPDLSLQYSSGGGNGIFGQGWGFSFPKITRKTDKGIPIYQDEKDVFVLSGAEDLVPKVNDDGTILEKTQLIKTTEGNQQYYIYTYHPRVEGLFARIEFWRNAPLQQSAEHSFWRVTTKENITSIYGLSESSKLCHSDSKLKVFEWILELTYDTKGNYTYYECKQDKITKSELTKDNGEISLFEKHRISQADRVYQVYLQKVKYGNIKPLNGLVFQEVYSQLIDRFSNNEHFFEVLFDYSNCTTNQNCKIDDNIYDDVSNHWGIRNDPFSYFRAGFEIRTYRLCRRVLMFHRIPLGENPTQFLLTLVRSTDFQYEEDKYNGITKLEKVIQRGYRKPEKGKEEEYYSEEYHLGLNSYIYSSTYAIKSLPPLEFKYSTFEPEKQKFKAVTADNRDLPARSLSSPNLTLVDLYGNGLQDILETTNSGYYYWKNKGNGHFSNRLELKSIPLGINLDMPGIGFGDMAGDGQADLLVHEGSNWGFYEANGKGGWSNFRPYETFPSFSLSDPNIKLLDLTGDGKSDALKTDSQSLVWYPCLGEKGFGEPKYIRKKYDLEEFPNVAFSDSRVKLADMTGDNLNDIVLVNNRRIDYWPNIGNGKFGKRITLGVPSKFGTNFDPNRLFLVDIDGTGTADLLYIEANQIRFWFNQSGNQFSREYKISGTPSFSYLDSVQVVDLYGCGCTGILWSSDYKGSGKSHYFYLDLMGGIKPNLLVEMNNNMGSTTKAQYKPSTHFYLEDEKLNHKRNWISTLPFPVQVLEKVEKIDHISRTKLVTNYKYHHGFYDGREREFRGFAYVEQIDTEFFDQFYQADLHDDVALRKDKGYYTPPVLTKTWFHTGTYLDQEVKNGLSFNQSYDEIPLDVHNLFQFDYWSGDPNAFLLEDTVLERKGRNLNLSSLREAYRAMRGQVLRQEIFGLDGSDKEQNPYTVTESNFKVNLLQAKGNNEHGVFFVHSHETLSYHYERFPDDPRMTQELTLEVDEFGNVEQSCNIVYPRRNPSSLDEQRKSYITLSENKFINKIEGSSYYIGIVCEGKSFEIHGLEDFIISQNGKKLERSSLRPKLDEIIGFESFHIRNKNGIYKRLLSWNKNIFKGIEDARKTSYDFGGDIALPFGKVDDIVIPFESYQAVFHFAQLEELFGWNKTDRVKYLSKAGYVQMDDHWWVSSGQQAFDSNNFFVLTTSYDPFGNKSKVEYDREGLYLLMQSSIDALNNKVEVLKNDWITLQPSFIKDPNDNGSKVCFDALGLVAASAIMEKPQSDGAVKNGDPLNNFYPLWNYDDRFWRHVDNPYLGTNKGVSYALDYLKDATSSMIYDLWGHIRKKIQFGKLHEPPAVYSIAREEHYSKNSQPSIQRSLMYFDGLGQEIQTKVEAPPKNGQHRWIGSGWKTYNNKGKVVRQFEPFYTTNTEFEDIYQLALEGKYGVSPIIFYDPLGRVIATIHPNGSFEKTEFSAWEQKNWDVNDTIKWKPNDYDNHPIIRYWREVNPNFKTWKERALESNLREMLTTVEKTEAHAETFTETKLDSLGRPFLSIAINNEVLKVDEDGNVIDNNTLTTKTTLDIQGNDLVITDPMNLDCFLHEFNMLQQKIYINSKDAGEKWMLSSIDEQVVWSKDAKNTIIESEYDKLRRPTNIFVIPFGEIGNRFTSMITTYGKSGTQNAISKEKNEVGQVIKVKDQSGIIENTKFDFKGNVESVERKLWNAYGIDIDVSRPNNKYLVQNNKMTYTSTSTFDALNRVIQSTAPDASIFYPAYNESNQLKSIVVDLQDNSSPITFVRNVQYNAKGQRLRIEYGSNITSYYEYDEDTFRLTKLLSKKNGTTLKLQDIHYTYDPIGNITEIRDEAFETIFNCNERIEPKSEYTYDAIYRLIEATGRQHVSYRGCEYMNQKKQSTLINFRCELFTGSTDQKKITTYRQYFEYDKSGNLLKIQHIPNNNNSVRWTRTQNYNTSESNQILSTSTDCDNYYINSSITHDDNGNIVAMPHLNQIEWDYANQMRKVALNSGEGHFVYYVYGSDGMRSRKVIVRNDEVYTQRIYLNGYELFIEGNKVKPSLHIMDDQDRIASIYFDKDDTKVSYQLSNHLGSASLETNQEGKLLSYEEYSAYGSSVFIVHSLDTSQAEKKRYRYSGKERDDETGLYYYGARYYAPWMGRWMKADPIGKDDGLNIFSFVKGNSIIRTDPIGLNGSEVQSKDEKDLWENATDNLTGWRKEYYDLIEAINGIEMLERLGGHDRYGNNLRERVHPASKLTDQFKMINQFIEEKKTLNLDDFPEDTKSYVSIWNTLLNEKPETYTGEIYSMILSAGAMKSNYISAALNTGDSPINNAVRLRLQQLLVGYFVFFGKDKMEKMVGTGLFSYEIHEEAFLEVAGVHTIGGIPWISLEWINVPSFAGDSIGGWGINKTIEWFNSPEDTAPAGGEVMRSVIDFASSKLETMVKALHD